ncbi:hypothetical protein [Haloglomus halophilum]|uniref:hypothetical protein n=1 Tax=Haloglomus halophilum TaxID=2962672 RepID=UPI0020C97A22|nr:hypothetical protein [Haloglomus halophilum]
MADVACESIYPQMASPRALHNAVEITGDVRNPPMILLQPETLAIITRWSILVGGPLSTGSPISDVAAATGPFAYGIDRPIADLGTTSISGTQYASLIPLQSTADLSTLTSDLKDAIKVPSWVGNLLKWTGLITMILGIIAYFVSPSVNNRRRGFAMATTGIILSIIGFAFPIFIGLIDYVLSG